MAAVVVISETNGPDGSSVSTLDPSNLNFGSTDASELNPATYPITAAAGSHSYEKWLRLYLSDLGGSSIVDNLKMWVSNLGGGYETGEGIQTNARTSGYVSATYPAPGPVNTDSTVATQTIPTSEPGGPNIGIAGGLSGQLTTAPAYSDWVVIQLGVSELTPAGSLNQKTISFQWDEQ